MSPTDRVRTKPCFMIGFRNVIEPRGTKGINSDPSCHTSHYAPSRDFKNITPTQLLQTLPSFHQERIRMELISHCFKGVFADRSQPSLSDILQLTHELHRVDYWPSKNIEGLLLSWLLVPTLMTVEGTPLYMFGLFWVAPCSARVSRNIYEFRTGSRGLFVVCYNAVIQETKQHSREGNMQTSIGCKWWYVLMYLYCK